MPTACGRRQPAPKQSWCLPGKASECPDCLRPGTPRTTSRSTRPIWMPRPVCWPEHSGRGALARCAVRSDPCDPRHGSRAMPRPAAAPGGTEADERRPGEDDPGQHRSRAEKSRSGCPGTGNVAWLETGEIPLDQAQMQIVQSGTAARAEQKRLLGEQSRLEAARTRLGTLEKRELPQLLRQIEEMSGRRSWPGRSAPG